MKNKYISLAFRSKDYFEDTLSFYYFRIFQLRREDNLIFPLDSNIGPTCQEDNKCFFLLKNDYNQFYLNFSIFTYNLTERDGLTYIKQNLIDTIDISQNTLNNIICSERVKENIFRDNSRNNNISYILFEIQKNGKNILSSFYDSEKEIYPQIYAPQIYGVNSIINFHFCLQFEYRLIFIWINGNGKIMNNKKNDKNLNLTLNQNTQGKIFSFPSLYLQDISSINEEDFFFLWILIFYSKII